MGREAPAQRIGQAPTPSGGRSSTEPSGAHAGEPLDVHEFLENLRLEILGGERVTLSTVNLDDADRRELERRIRSDATLNRAVEFHP